MPSSGIQVNQELVDGYNNFKKKKPDGKEDRFLAFCMEKENWKILEPPSASEDFVENLRQLGAEYSMKCMFVTGFIEFTTEDGRLTSKPFCIYSAPTECPVKEKMIFSTSVGNLKGKLNVDAKMIQREGVADVTRQELIEAATSK